MYITSSEPGDHAESHVDATAFQTSTIMVGVMFFTDHFTPLNAFLTSASLGNACTRKLRSTAEFKNACCSSSDTKHSSRLSNVWRCSISVETASYTSRSSSSVIAPSADGVMFFNMHVTIN